MIAAAPCGIPSSYVVCNVKDYL
jgi:small subunit ribosomal protein S14e